MLHNPNQLQIIHNPNCYTKQATCSRAVLIHPKSEGLWHSTKLWSTYPECSTDWQLCVHMSQTQLGSTLQGQKIWLDMPAMFVYWSPGCQWKQERKRLQATHVPGSLETPSKRDMLADPNCLRWWNHWISRPSAATTSKKLGKKKGAFGVKRTLNITLQCLWILWRPRMADPGTKARDKWRETSGDEQTKCSGKRTQAPKVRNKWSKTTHQAHLVSKWTSQCYTP